MTRRLIMACAMSSHPQAPGRLRRAHEVAMSTLDRARADGQIQRNRAGIVQLVETVGEVAPGRTHRGLRVIYRRGFDVWLHLRNHLAGLAGQQSRLLGSHPILGGIWRADHTGRGQIVANVKQVDQEASLRSEL